MKDIRHGAASCFTSPGKSRRRLKYWLHVAQRVSPSNLCCNSKQIVRLGRVARVAKCMTFLEEFLALAHFDNCTCAYACESVKACACACAHTRRSMTEQKSARLDLH